MKNWIKIVVTVIVSIISFISLFFIVAFLWELDTMNYPSTIIIPVFALMALIVSLIVFCVWCYKYSRDNKNLAKLVVSLIVFTIAITSIVLTPTINRSITGDVSFDEDVSAYSDWQVISYLEENGYNFKASEMTRTYTTSTYTTRYIFVYDSEFEICFQKITNSLIGKRYSWKNSNTNDEWAQIKDTYENDNNEKEEQYSEYKKWLKHLGLTSKQVTDALDYYESTVTEYEQMPNY
ncbi:MAG: hypothetical protein J6K66_01040 [Clostridia bacterium]|nr:hypothetical protein [Clostridia bacterium]